jgi:FtsP/CotA-like multicopper oxidase with cupredoxin domain
MPKQQQQSEQQSHVPSGVAPPASGRARPRAYRRTIVASLCTLALVVPIGVLWWSSLLPDSYAVTEMGRHDFGGGSGAPAHASGGRAGSGSDIDISTLVASGKKADVRVELTARAETVPLAGGRAVAGYTLNGTSPGPTIRARAGELVEVTLTNDNVARGITLHWHGIDVPNAVDGVAGVTQDAVPAGGRHTYRFLADHPGTYWYHSHQMSHEQVVRGLLGAIVIDPATKPSKAPQTDVTTLVHHYQGVRTINGREGDQVVDAAPGSLVRVRVIETDNNPLTVWVSGAGYRVAAVDGRDLNGPTEVHGRTLVIPAGGRADLDIVMPKDGAGVRVELGGSNAVLLGQRASQTPRQSAPSEPLDLLEYGTPTVHGLGSTAPTRTFDYVIGRRPGFLDGRPGLWWTINGKTLPDVPMFVVDFGDVVRMRIVNRSGDLHPMHLHGHHMLVLSRNGEPSTGSPWWVDSLTVEANDTYEVAFLADNPGIWIDHCHDLAHAQDGLIAHLMYAGYTSPYRIGGGAGNEPE